MLNPCSLWYITKFLFELPILFFNTTLNFSPRLLHLFDNVSHSLSTFTLINHQVQTEFLLLNTLLFLPRAISIIHPWCKYSAKLIFSMCAIICVICIQCFNWRGEGCWEAKGNLPYERFDLQSPTYSKYRISAYTTKFIWQWNKIMCAKMLGKELSSWNESQRLIIMYFLPLFVHSVHFISKLYGSVSWLVTC